MNNVIQFGIESDWVGVHINKIAFASQDMGEKTITISISVEPDITLDFSHNWEITYQGEKYVHDKRDPQGSKDSSTLLVNYELIFEHWAVLEMKRFYFVEMTSIDTGTAIADKYVASLTLNIIDFTNALNKVLQYYYGNKIFAKINPIPSDEELEKKTIEISYTKIWEVITSIYDTYQKRWEIHYNSTEDRYEIIFCVTPIAYSSHTFSYGYDGGLQSIERTLQSEEITNILLGRGGSKNLPTKYFKDPVQFIEGAYDDNEVFKPDPDAIPELRNIVFNELRDSAYRSYVRGWKTNSHRIQSLPKVSGTGDYWTLSALDTRDEGLYARDWAYKKGCDDTTFNPPEYAIDNASVDKYGEKWGNNENDEEIFPSIKGRTRGGLGRIDEIVGVSEIVEDEEPTYLESYTDTYKDYKDELFRYIKPGEHTYEVNYNDIIIIPVGYIGTLKAKISLSDEIGVTILPEKTEYILTETKTNKIVPISAITEGEYYVKIKVTLYNPYTHDVTRKISVTNVETYLTPQFSEWVPTFDIWVKNIWGTQKGLLESEKDYTDRVWIPILGSKGQEAKVTFDTGWLSGHSDWEFIIVGVAYDVSKTLSHWRITLQKCSAEVEATGLYIPRVGLNAEAGDKFFFTGIEMPFEYVELAEKDLTAAKEDTLEDIADIKAAWNVSVDNIRWNELGLTQRIHAGSLIRIKDIRFTQNQPLDIYVESMNIEYLSESLIPSVQLTLADNPIVSKKSRSGLVSLTDRAINRVNETINGLNSKNAAMNQNMYKYISTKVDKTDLVYATNEDIDNLFNE